MTVGVFTPQPQPILTILHVFSREPTPFLPVLLVDAHHVVGQWPLLTPAPARWRVAARGARMASAFLVWQVPTNSRPQMLSFLKRFLFLPCVFRCDVD